MAATLARCAARDDIDDEWAILMNGKNDAPFPDRFRVSGLNTGVFHTARARPTLGTSFALLAKGGIKVSGD